MSYIYPHMFPPGHIIPQWPSGERWPWPMHPKPWYPPIYPTPWYPCPNQPYYPDPIEQELDRLKKIEKELERQQQENKRLKELEEIRNRLRKKGVEESKLYPFKKINLVPPSLDDVLKSIR